MLQYSEAIQLDPDNYLLYSNRSAAFLKLNKPQEALLDANRTIALQPTFHKGYGRKGAAYHLMKKYDQAVAAYKEGLKICPGEEHLQKGLAASKRARLNSHSATRSARRSSSTARASKSRSRQATKAPTVSAFVRQTRASLALQMATIQAQLDFINELAAMTDEQKADMLFTLIDKDGDGTIDASELAVALRKRNAELSLEDSLERAIAMVAVFDTNADAKLDTEEFKRLMDSMAKELELDFHEFSEFLVLQLLFGKDEEQNETILSKDDVEEAVLEHERYLNILKDPRLEELFQLFDNDGSGELTFQEVAIGLYHISSSMDRAARTTMEVLLMIDKDDSRTLDYEEFGRLIMAVLASAQMTFDELADELALALANEIQISDEEMTKLMVADAFYELANEQNSLDALAYGRLQKLFDIWDVDGSGTITLQELTTGIRSYHNAAGIQDDSARTAEALLKFDGSGDQALDRHEFAHAMVNYAEVYGVEVHVLIDFMTVTYALGDERANGYQNGFRQSLGEQKNRRMSAVHTMFYDETEDADFQADFDDAFGY